MITKISKKPVYFDNAATSQLDPAALRAMLPYLQDPMLSGNASSKTHVYGASASQAVARARQQTAAAIGAKHKDIVFTSGATEANNLAILGFAAGYQRKTNRRVLTASTEHKAVLEPVASLRNQGFATSILPVASTGLLDPGVLEKSLQEGACLVSVMLVNNETGVIQPIKEIAKLCRKYKATLHVDAAQAVGKLALDVAKLKIGLLSMSAHKSHGPKGVGALYVAPSVKLAPLQFGGGQERGLRAGTLSVPQIVGMGYAFWQGSRQIKKEQARVSALNSILVDAARSIKGCRINGEKAPRVPQILNLSFDGVPGTSLLPTLAPEFALASGSACTSAKVEVSHVLRAMGLKRALAQASIRISMGRYTTAAEVKHLASRLKQIIPRLAR